MACSTLMKVEKKGGLIMYCYECSKQGVTTPAVALCRCCSAGLCIQHLRETAELFAVDKKRLGPRIISPSCHHDTWAARGRPVTPAVPIREAA